MQNRDEEMLKLLSFIQSCDTKELAYIVDEIRHLRTLVGFVLGEEMAFCCEGISVIDDAIHVILNPREVF